MPLFEGEAVLLAAPAETLGGGAREARAAFITAVAQRQLRFLRQSSGGAAKLVVFVSDEELAATIAQALHAAEAEQVFDGAYGKSATEAFAACPGPAIAVFGPSGEEGLNLHFTDAILHGDLPTSVSRLEQRIGRLDRFGRTRGPIRHVIVCPAAEEDTPWSAWCDLLRDGFGIFDRPVSDLQFVLSEIEAEVRRRRLAGPQAVLDFREDLAGLLAQHRERLDEQYAMDQLALGRESALALAEAFEEAEADEADLQSRVGSLLAATLQFGLRRASPDVFTLEWGPNTQLPERPWRSVFAPGLERPLTWKRRLSVSRPKTALLRPGASLIDALERLLDWDDRGAAFATWRLEPGAGGPGEERLAFRLCWVIAPPNPPAEVLLPGEDGDALRRQAEAFLQPWTLTQHLGPDLRPIEDQAWLEILQRPYQPEPVATGGRDFNLGSRPEWLRQVIDGQTFAQLCAKAAERPPRRCRLRRGFGRGWPMRPHGRSASWIAGLPAGSFAARSTAPRPLAAPQPWTPWSATWWRVPLFASTASAPWWWPGMRPKGAPMSGLADGLGFAALSQALTGARAANDFTLENLAAERLRKALGDPTASELDLAILLRHALLSEMARQGEAATVWLPRPASPPIPEPSTPSASPPARCRRPAG